MIDRHGSARTSVEESVLRGPGHTSPALRQAVAARGDIAAELLPLVDKIRQHAYRVTADDLAALKSRYSDDQLFEIILSAALGAAQDRLRAGLDALGGP